MGWFTKKKKRPDATDVAIRAIVLRHVISYALMTPTREMLGNVSTSWSEDEKRSFTRDAEVVRDNFWATLGGYEKFLSPLERSFSRTTMTTITDAQLISASWRVEALVPLLWALQVVDEIPPYDTQSSPDLVSDSRFADLDAFISNASLRPSEEIDAARAIAEAWHWRSRTRQLIEDGIAFPDSPEVVAAGFTSFDSIVRMSANSHEGDGTFDKMIDEDFPAFGKAYRDLTDEEWTTTRSITMERHLALNWLCGYAPGHRWDETPTDT
jgi:hypothetical protein